jgi:F5/8 type C domain
VRAGAAAVALLLLLAAGPDSDRARAVDDFEDISAWQAAPSEGVDLKISSAQGAHGRALRADFDFHGRAGWAALRKTLSLALPDRYEFAFALRGDALANDLEFKLIDSSGENVWWAVQKNFVPSAGWRILRLKKRHFSFAWGPAGGGEIRHVATLEIAITAGSGGKGWIELDDLTLREVPALSEPPPRPVATASCSDPGSDPARAIDGDVSTAWTCRDGAPAWLAIDFGQPREFGGLTIRWEPGRTPARFTVEDSEDGRDWKTARSVEGAGGQRSDLLLPESEARFVRLRFLAPGGGSGYGIREVTVRSLAEFSSPNSFFRTLARESPRGTFPRSFSGEQAYWTVVGESGLTPKALVGEDGAVEPAEGSFSVEPFLSLGGPLKKWSDVSLEQSLERGDLPIPTVVWRLAKISLATTVLALPAEKGVTLQIRYRIANGGSRRLRGRLILAIRPFQVNPPAQFLNRPGGVSLLPRIVWNGRCLAVDGGKRVVPLVAAARAGTSSFDSGSFEAMLESGAVPSAASVQDSTGFAWGALSFDFDLSAGASDEVSIEIPPSGSQIASALPRSRARLLFSRHLAESAKAWREQLDRVGFDLPAEARILDRTMRTNLAYILIHREEAALRPGSRSYARSWIRDGAMISAALLRLGHPEIVREYAEWFAGFQSPEGRVPCCVDRRGADPVVENDSHGELIFLLAEYWRFTKDAEWVRRFFPHVEGAVSWIDRERQRRRTPEYRAAGKESFFGLLPESISHEGYSAKPVHSYWDDFWALKGLRDATELAAAMGRQDLRARWGAIAEEFAADLHGSIRRVMATRGLDTLPASADLADFDPTSMTIALDPAGEIARLPEPALSRTFERYLEDFRKRWASATWEDYTPYEIRNVGAFVRLGWRGPAHELLGFFLESRRPPEWNAWAEVVGREPRKPRFIGDLPHAWVGSDFIRAVLDLFAWERASDGAVVLAAGVPSEWLEGARGISVRNLRTPHGLLTFALRREKGVLHMHISGALSVPPGGLALRPPLAADGYRATVNGREVDFAGAELVVRAVPADVVFTPRPRSENEGDEERGSRSARPARGGG